MTKLNNPSREEWLQAAVRELQADVFTPAALEIPADVKVSCGWPSSGGVGSRKMTVGQCFNRASSKAGINEIFISPTQNDSVKVLDILAHELIHAIDDCENGHKAAFKRMAVAIGLEGKMTSTVAGEELEAKLRSIVEDMGEYPHEELSVSNRKKQSTRMIKVECEKAHCDFSFRASRKQIMHIDFEEKGCLIYGCNGALKIAD